MSTFTRMASAIATETAKVMNPPTLIALLLAAVTPALAAEPLPGASVESLLSAAREGSPDLRLAQLEAEAARAWMRSTTGDDIAASRSGVMARGRTQVRP